MGRYLGLIRVEIFGFGAPRGISSQRRQQVYDARSEQENLNIYLRVSPLQEQSEWTL